MKKSICLYFQVHQPTRLRTYRFFDIGKNSHYYDDFANRTIVKRIAQKSYLPMNAALLDAIKRSNGAFKVAFSISGSALEQFDRYAPEVLDSFRELAATGCVEFLAETYYHSLASLKSESEFEHQVRKHEVALQEFLGVKPTAFRNTELLYSDNIGRMVYDLGYKTMLTEGARHIMGWKSPNFVYSDDIQPELSLLLRNYGLSDDIALKFSDKNSGEWPMTCEKYTEKLKATDGDIINISMDYATFGEYQSADSGIIDFMKYLPEAVLAADFAEFVTPTEAAAKHASVASLDVAEPISWTGEERDVTAWLGNELQNDAFNKVYSLSEKLYIANDPDLWEDYGHLQESDHFYYMNTKFFSEGSNRNPYDSPYEAFINYMNALSDFIIRLEDAYATADGVFETPVPLVTVTSAPAKKTAAKKAPAKKAPAKKTTEKKTTAKKVAKK
ncbi:MAG: glycoside hydrolase family 57 protein [Bacteroidales bacterium]|nr:glycoside hydrolase family 57 protein [Bacteroidales bacterium]